MNERIIKKLEYWYQTKTRLADLKVGDHHEHVDQMFQQSEDIEHRMWQRIEMALDHGGREMMELRRQIRDFQQYMDKVQIPKAIVVGSNEKPMTDVQ